jgi:hypothetical protein
MDDLEKVRKRRKLGEEYVLSFCFVEGLIYV